MRGYGTCAGLVSPVRGKAKIAVFGCNSDLLIERQLAVLYDGGTKGKDWCE